MTVKIRAFTDEDMPTLINLLNETQRDSYEFVPYTEQDFSIMLEEGKTRILMAAENAQILGSTAYNDGRWGEEIRWLAVLEIPNRKAIEDQLVKEVEKYVKGEKLFTGVDAGSSKINDWVERGYKLEGGLYHMIAKLDSVKPLPTFPEGIIIRSLWPSEEKEFVDLVNVGFDWERMQMGMIQRWKNDCPPFDENWIQVADVDGKLVSAVASRPDTDYNVAFCGKRGYLGPAVTLPEHRNKNLASTLTHKAMNFLFEKGMNSVCLYTSEQNIPSITLLRKLSFEVAHNWKFMRKYFQKQ